MKMKLIFSILATLLMSNMAQASFNYYSSERFVCSDGKTYDLALHISGGYSATTWSLSALCSAGHLINKRYDWKGFEIDENSHPDLQACAEESSASVISCYEEFKELNGSRGYTGRNDYVKVIHGGERKELPEPDRAPIQNRPSNRYENATGGNR